MWSRSTEVSRRKNSQVGELAGVAVVGAADPRQQARQRVDRDRVAGLDRALGDEHRQGRLAGADVALEPEPAALGDVVVERRRCTRGRSPPTSRLRGSRAMSATGGRSKLTPWYFAGSTVRTPRVRAWAMRRSRHSQGRASVVVLDDPAAAVAAPERARAGAGSLHPRARHRRRPRRPAAAARRPARPGGRGRRAEMLWNDAYFSRNASWTVSIGPLRFLRTISSATPSSFARSASSTSSSPKFL